MSHPMRGPRSGIIGKAIGVSRRLRTLPKLRLLSEATE